jgi:hypothetical protein
LTIGFSGFDGPPGKSLKCLSRDKADVYLAVIARSEATKQFILSMCGEMDCFASLAMMGVGTVLAF